MWIKVEKRLGFAQLAWKSLNDISAYKSRNLCSEEMVEPESSLEYKLNWFSYTDLKANTCKCYLLLSSF